MADTTHIENVSRSLQGLTGKLFAAQTGVAALRFAFDSLWQKITRIEKPEQALLTHQNRVLAELHTMTTATGLALPGLEREVELRRHALRALELHLKLQHEIDNGLERRLVIVGGELAMLVKAASVYADIQQNLIEANSDFSYRWKLANDTMQVVAETGMSYERITKAAAALVHYGMDEEQTWQRNVKLVGELEGGIGLSVQHSARLATIVERQVKGNFKDVADTLSVIVDRTALAADEAAKMAESITLAVGSMREGLGGQIDSVIRTVGEYESAFKRLGGQTGEITKLVDSLTTIQGMPAAGLLGVNNPEFLASAKGTEDVLRRVGATVNSFTAGIGGWQRQARLDALAQVMGVSARQLNLMGRMQEQVNATRNAEIGIHQRFQQQMLSTGQGLYRITNEIWSLTQTALYPAVVLLNRVVNALADGLAWINKHQTVALTISSTIGTSLALIGSVSAVKGIAAIGRLGGSLIAMAMGAASARMGVSMLAIRLRSFAMNLVPARMAGMLPGFATGVTGLTVVGMLSLLAGVAAIAAGISAILYFYRKKVEAEQQARDAAAAADRVHGSLVEAQQSALSRGLIYRDMDLINRALYGTNGNNGLVANTMTDQGLSFEQAMAKVQDELVKPLAQVLRVTEATKTISNEPTGPKGSAELEAFLKDFNTVTTEQVRQQKTIAAQQLEVFQKSAVHQQLQMNLRQGLDMMSNWKYLNFDPIVGPAR